MIYCRKCGNQMPDDSVFCSKCGCNQNESIDNSASPSEASLHTNDDNENSQYSSNTKPTVNIANVALYIAMVIFVTGFLIIASNEHWF